MKSDFFSSLFVVFAICVFLSVCPFSLYAEHPHACLLSGDEPAILSINQNDTIYFDFLHASCTSQHIEIPVYISTDDPVYALDFALKFNPSQFTFASFVNHKAYLNAATNFNPADSTLRFTSFSFTQVIESNSPLITLVFNYGNFNQVSMAAFDSVEAQLNGDYCSHFGLSAGLNPVILPSGSIAITPGDSLELSIPLLSGQSCLWTTGSSNSSIWVHNPGTYTVTVTNTNGCSGSASRTISNPNPLPVELVSFSALSATDYVQLEWTTASETYNDYFIVERSTDAFAWEIVGTVNGAGNSSTSLTYILIDSDPLPGTSYYRLKQVDFNGTVTESPVIVCHHLTPEPNNLTVKIIPNPSTGTDVTLLALGKIPDSGILILVTDNYGRQLFKTSSHQSAEKTSLIPLHFETALTPGVYLVTALTDQQASVTKLIVQ